MGIYEYVILAGAVLAIVAGLLRLPRALVYVVLLLIAAWPSYTMGVDKGFGFATVAVVAAIIFLVFFVLHWLAYRFSPRRTKAVS